METKRQQRAEEAAQYNDGPDLEILEDPIGGAGAHQPARPDPPSQASHEGLTEKELSSLEASLKRTQAGRREKDLKVVNELLNRAHAFDLQFLYDTASVRAID